MRPGYARDLRRGRAELLHVPVRRLPLWRARIPVRLDKLGWRQILEAPRDSPLHGAMTASSGPRHLAPSRSGQSAPAGHPCNLIIYHGRMNFETALLALLLGGVSPPHQAPHDTRSEPASDWFSEDKLKHFIASFVVTSVSASASRAAGLDRAESVGIGAGVGVAAGLIKEHEDSRTGGAFSGADLVWDAAGIGASILLLRAGE